MLLLFLGFFLPIIVMFNFKLSLILIYSWFVCFYSSFNIYLLGINKRKSFIAACFWVFVYVFVGLCSMLQYGNQFYPWGDSYDDVTVLTALFVVIVGIVFFDIGYRSVKFNEYRNVRVGESFFNKIEISEEYIFLRILCCIIISLVVLSVSGGIQVLLVDRTQSGNAVGEAVGGTDDGVAAVVFFHALIRIPPFVAFICGYLVWQGMNHGVKRKNLGWLIILTFFYTIFVTNPIANPRFIFSVVAISLFLTLSMKPLKNHWLASILVFGLVFVFPLADMFRRSLDVDVVQAISEFSLGDDMVYSGDFDAFQQIINSLKTVDVNGYQYGAQVLGSFLFWFPRSLWPGKPENSGSYIGESVGYDFLNLSAPLWAEFFVDGGFIFVAIGFFLYGKMVKSLDNYSNLIILKKKTTLCAVSIIMAAFQVIILRGSLMVAMSYVGVTIFFMFFVFSKKTN